MPLYPILPNGPVAETEPTTLAYEPNHKGIALARLISQFQGKQRIATFMAAFSRQDQAIEDMFWDLLTKRLLGPSTVGVQLDNLGRIIKQPRNGMADGTYRLMLAVRILINLSGGTPDQIIRILQRVLDLLLATNTIELQERAFAEFAIILHGAVPVDPAFLVMVVKAAKTAGIRFELEFSYADDFRSFTFASATTPASNPLTGFGDTLSLATGGEFASVRM